MGEFTNLGRDETVILQGKVHWARMIVPGLIAVLILIGGIGGDAFLGALIIALLIVALASIPLWTEKLVITNKRLYGKTGLIRTKTLDTPLNKVNTVSVSSGLIGKLFGYGKIHVTSSSGTYEYSSIAAPDVFRQTLMEQIERYDEERIKKQAAEMARAIKE